MGKQKYLLFVFYNVVRANSRKSNPNARLRGIKCEVNIKENSNIIILLKAYSALISVFGLRTGPYGLRSQVLCLTSLGDKCCSTYQLFTL